MLRVMIILFMLTGSAGAAERASSSLPPGVDCDAIRAKVHEFGRARAILWALENGFTMKEIWQARKICKV
jgi:hypothetical protein